MNEFFMHARIDLVFKSERELWSVDVLSNFRYSGVFLKRE